MKTPQRAAPRAVISPTTAARRLSKKKKQGMTPLGRKRQHRLLSQLTQKSASHCVAQPKAARRLDAEGRQRDDADDSQRRIKRRLVEGALAHDHALLGSLIMGSSSKKLSAAKKKALWDDRVAATEAAAAAKEADVWRDKVKAMEAAALAKEASLNASWRDREMAMIAALSAKAAHAQTEALRATDELAAARAIILAKDAASKQHALWQDRLLASEAAIVANHASLRGLGDDRLEAARAACAALAFDNAKLKDNAKELEVQAQSSQELELLRTRAARARGTTRCKLVCCLHHEAQRLKNCRRDKTARQLSFLSSHFVEIVKNASELEAHSTLDEAIQHGLQKGTAASLGGATKIEALFDAARKLLERTYDTLERADGIGYCDVNAFRAAAENAALRTDTISDGLFKTVRDRKPLQTTAAMVVPAAVADAPTSSPSTRTLPTRTLTTTPTTPLPPPPSPTTTTTTTTLRVGDLFRTTGGHVGKVVAVDADATTVKYYNGGDNPDDPACEPSGPTTLLNTNGGRFRPYARKPLTPNSGGGQGPTPTVSSPASVAHALL